jgi:hypothetical protein
MERSRSASKSVISQDIKVKSTFTHRHDSIAATGFSH